LPVLLETLRALQQTRLPVGLYLALQNTDRILQTGAAQAVLADVWQIILRLEEGRYADIAANWRGARDGLLSDMDDFKITEVQLSRRVNDANAAFAAYAPAYGFDGVSFAAFWDHVAQLIAAGQRAMASQLVRQLDASPGDILNLDFTSPDAEAAAALQNIRMQLQNPDLAPSDRDYLERLLPR
jgi:hypothetical protein